MKTVSTAVLACVMALHGAAGLAQTAAPAKPTAVPPPPRVAAPAPAPSPAPSPAAATPAAGTGTPEPKVQVTTIEDDGARIDELRVRGFTQRIVVSPKRAGAAPYEIITGDGSRDLGDGANTSRGAAGKRVWNVLKF